MASDNVFKKLHQETEKKSDFEEMLEHLDLPPKVAKFINKYKFHFLSVLALVLIVVLSWSIYDVVKDHRINNSSALLASAMQQPESKRGAILQKVVSEYSGTPSARWAMVTLAHIDLKNGKFKVAASEYGKIKNELDPTNPLFALVSFGMAQAQEAGKEYDQAFNGYQALSKISGYQGIGLLGMARIDEIQGKKENALSTYEQYLATPEGQNPKDPERAFVIEKIGRLKAKQ